MATAVVVSVPQVQCISPFDYNSVEPGLAKYLRGEADRIRRQYTGAIVQVGKALIRVKHYLSHGEFVRWVESEAGIPARTAQGYMRVGRWASDKNATVAHLPPTLLYVLSASSTPKELVDSILKRVDSGDQIPSITALRQELRALRIAKQPTYVNVGVAHAAAHSDQDSSIVANAAGARELLREAVELVRRGLSAADFHHFRDIMTCECVLDDAHLARSIQEAFLAADYPTAEKSNEGMFLSRIADPVAGANGASLLSAAECPYSEVVLDRDEAVLRPS